MVKSVENLEAKPDSKGRKEMLREEMVDSKAEQDPELRQAAQDLLEQIKKQPGGEQHIQQAIGSFIAQADRSSTATVNVNQPKDFLMAEEATSNQSITGSANAQADERSNANTISNAPTFNFNLITTPPTEINPSLVGEAEVEQVTYPETNVHIWNIPYSLDQYFTGRDIILKDIYNAFHDEKLPTYSLPLAITGLGGIGKTQTAVQYAYLHQAEYSIVLWVRADRPETLLSDFVTIAGLLGLIGKDASEQNLAVNAVKHWMELHAGWLLILDNADDLALVKNFLPSPNRGHILLTTRIQPMGRMARHIDLEKMTPEEGTLFLLRRVNLLQPDASLDEADPPDRNKAEEISLVMDGLPLALEQAGAYIEETYCSLSTYLELYQKQHTLFLTWQSAFESEQSKTVATTWSLSFEKIEQANPAAVELLRFASFLHPDAIPEELITFGASYLGPVLEPVATDPWKLNEALAELRKYSLIGRTPNAPMFTIHRLVQTVIQDGMDTNLQRQWAEQTVKTVNQAFPNVEFQTWPQCERYLAHAQLCAIQIEKWKMISPEAARLLDVTGHYLYERANYAKAELLLLHALEMREQLFGLENIDVAETLNNLVALYRLQGKYTQAIPFCERALTIREHVLGGNHPEVARSLNNLARLYHHNSMYAQAETLYEQALEIRKQALGASHPEVAESLNDLASLYDWQGMVTQVGLLYEQALEIRKQALGASHPEVALSLNNLAGFYQEQGKYAQAEALYEQALEIEKQVFGASHPGYASTLNNLAALFGKQNKYPHAISLNRQSLEIRKQTFGIDHPDVAKSLHVLSVLYYKQNRIVEAKQYLEQSLTILEKVLGSEHPIVADYLGDLALLYQAQGNYNKAKTLYERILRIYKRTLVPEHPKVEAVRKRYTAILPKVKPKSKRKR